MPIERYEAGEMVCRKTGPHLADEGVTYLLGCLDKLRKNVKTMLPAVSKSAEVIQENGIEILSGPKSAQAYQNRRDRQV